MKHFIEVMCYVLVGIMSGLIIAKSIQMHDTELTIYTGILVIAFFVVISLKN